MKTEKGIKTDKRKNKPRLARPCIKCGEKFIPLGFYFRVCSKCSKKGRKK